MPAKKKTLTDKQYAEYLSMLSNKQYNAMAKKKKSLYAPGTFKVKTSTYGTVKTKAALRRGTTSSTEKNAPLPESCHYSKTAAVKAADQLRVKKIKSRVVTSGQFYCVYSVGKCRKGTLVGTGRAKTTRKKKSA